MSQTVTLHREDFDTEDQLSHAISEACDLMESIYEKGDYPHLKVQRTWSRHNPIITGEMAVPSAYRWFLKREDRKSTRLNSSHVAISYAVFCLKQKKKAT